MAVAFFLGIFGALILLAATTGIVILRGVGKWLVRKDPLQQATAIAVLSGNIPTRALEAAALYHEGDAKEIWLTHPKRARERVEGTWHHLSSEDAFNIRVLRRAGVPAKAIRVLDTPIVNTEEELDVISTTLQNSVGESVIIVTNKAHTRRVHILWAKYFGTRGEAIVHHRFATNSSSGSP